MLKFVLHGIELLVGVVKLVPKVVFRSADQCARMGDRLGDRRHVMMDSHIVSTGWKRLDSPGSCI